MREERITIDTTSYCASVCVLRCYEYIKQFLSISKDREVRRLLTISKKAIDEWRKENFPSLTGKFLLEHIVKRMAEIERHFSIFFYSLRGMYVKNGYEEKSDEVALRTAIDSILDINTRLVNSGNIEDRFLPKATYYDNNTRCKVTRNVQDVIASINLGYDAIIDDADCQRGVDVLWKNIKRLAEEDTSGHKVINKIY